MNLAIFIANDGKNIGRDRFIHYIDGNKFNLRKSNLLIVDKNEYIINGEETTLIIRTSSADMSNPVITTVDTICLPQIQEYVWRINNNYIMSTTKEDRHKRIRLHVLIMSLHEEIDDNLSIDHIDRNRLNNKYSNLRQVTNQINMLNRTFTKSKPGAILGVNRQSDAWVAMAPYLDMPNKVRRERFSVARYGEEQAKQMAIECRKKWELELGITSVIERK